MVIGQKIIQKINNTNNNIVNNSISIHINEYWITFCLFSDTKLTNVKKIDFLNKKNPSFILKTIKKYFKSFDKEIIPEIIRLIYYDKNCTLIPSVLFDKKNSLNFLKYNTKIQINDFAASDRILDDEIVNVFIPYININNYIFEKFRTFKFFHYSSLLIEKLRSKISDNISAKVFLNINDNFIDILYFKNKKINLYNSFDYFSSEDILYYLLFCLSVLKLNPENINVVCTGKIDIKSTTYLLLYKYVRNIELLNYKKILGIDDKFNKSNILLRYC